MIDFSSIDDLDRTGEAEALTMVPVGPVAHRFVHDQSYMRTIMGPFGSAKTTTTFQAIIMAGLWQHTAPDGMKYSRGCITRPTYGQLQDTVMKDWFAWFPKTRDNWNGDRLEHTVTLDIPGIAKLNIQVLFRACEDRVKAEQIFKGMQLTWLWPNEIDTQDPSVLEFGLPRLGRYPPAAKGGCAWYGMFADMNAPDVDNYTYDLLVNKNMGLPQAVEDALREKLGPNFRIAFHRQPGGLDPDAENLMNLPEGYYERLMVGKTTNWIRRFVHNQFGAVRNGQPVYEEFNDEIHTAKEDLKALDGVSVGLAVDGGSTPAAMFGQKDDMGRIRWLAEVVVFAPGSEHSLEQMDAESFGELCGEFWLENYGKHDFAGAWGDPAAWYGVEDKHSWVTLFWSAFKKKVGRGAVRWKLKPAPMQHENRLPERLKAVRDPLKKMIGGQPAFQLSPTCKVTRRGFNNGYVITRVQLSNGGGRWADKPLKNDFSHIHDAGQYLNLGLTKVGAVDDDGQPKSKAAKRRTPGGGKVNHGGSAFAPKR
ncbi:hypothetical protein [Novosphingobium sp. ST904]|uniref:hypothetical protein n=1 Tax=Novosphingobium sp. ST904 TaxID=1684385 RepID=UPI0006C8B87E|nr:hypothetical protein [Novosphingobium sp. ST904]KPH59177.1 hypothetical protein ADT71_23840 [Novosphingobium sp. ST904]TCM37734.1 hypothetical protein EDF59_110130 [Novosphingobium sp. ST904]